MVSARIDWPRLIQTLDVAKEYHGLTDRGVAECVGISASSLTRLRQGKALTAEGLAALVAWLYPSSCPAWIVPAEPTEHPAGGGA